MIGETETLRYVCSFFCIKMAKQTKHRWQHSRLAHNPGGVRLKFNGKDLGVFHALPCSLLKGSIDRQLTKVERTMDAQDDLRTAMQNPSSTLKKQELTSDVIIISKDSD